MGGVCGEEGADGACGGRLAARCSVRGPWAFGGCAESGHGSGFVRVWLLSCGVLVLALACPDRSGCKDVLVPLAAVLLHSGRELLGIVFHPVSGCGVWAWQGYDAAAVELIEVCGVPFLPHVQNVLVVRARHARGCGLPGDCWGCLGCGEGSEGAGEGGEKSAACGVHGGQCAGKVMGRQGLGECGRW